MDHNQDAERRTQADEQEPRFLRRMVRIGQDDSEIIVERRFGLIKGDAVLAVISRAFAGSHSKRMSATCQCTYSVHVGRVRSALPDARNTLATRAVRPFAAALRKPSPLPMPLLLRLGCL